MEKPITMLIKEFDENICDAINKSKLPMWKVRDEIEKVMKKVNEVCTQQEISDLAAYEASLNEEKVEE